MTSLVILLTSLMRLQKFISAAGITSRRKAEKLITTGRVKVDGKVITKLGTKVDPELSTVEVDDSIINLPAEKKYYLLYKPVGFVTTVRDPQKRPTIMKLLPKEKGLFPVGRLDKDTEGLLLITNDGELAHRLMHPRFGVSKTYLVTAEGIVPESSLDLLRKGIVLEEGRTSPVKIKVLSKDKNTTELELTLKEGKKRHIKRIFSAVGHPVLHLKRVSFAFLHLKGLKPGFYRPLTEEEVEGLLELTGLKTRSKR